MSKVSNAQMKYMDKYRKEHLRYIPIRFRIVEDKEILEWLDAKESKTAYIKKLILDDIEKNATDSE